MATVNIPTGRASSKVAWWHANPTVVKYRNNALIIKSFNSGRVYIGFECSLIAEGGYYRMSGSPANIKYYVSGISGCDSSSTYAYIRFTSASWSVGSGMTNASSASISNTSNQYLGTAPTGPGSGRTIGRVTTTQGKNVIDARKAIKTDTVYGNGHLRVGYTYATSTSATTTTYQDIDYKWSMPGLGSYVQYDRNGWSGTLPATLPSGFPGTNREWGLRMKNVTLRKMTGLPTRTGCDGHNYQASWGYWTVYRYKDSPERDIPAAYKYNGTYTLPDFPITLYARCGYPSGKIVFNGNGHTGGSQGTLWPTVQSGAYSISQSCGYTKTGYHFVGWYDAATGGNKVTKLANGIHSSSHGVYNLYAHWEPNDYVITFDKQGGTGGTDTVTITYNTTNPLPTVVAPDHATKMFAGYYTKTNGGGTQRLTDAPSWVNTTNTTFTGPTTLYALWEEPTVYYNVTYNKGTADTGSKPGAQKKWENRALTLASNSGNLAKASKSVTTNPFTVNFEYGRAVKGVTALKTLKTVTTSYTMSGWSLTSGGAKAYNLGGSYTANADLNLFPVFTSTDTTTENKTITLPAITYTPASTECVTVTVNGWYTAATGGTKVGNPGDSYTPTATTTLYARITTTQKTALIKYVDSSTITRTLNPPTDYYIESNDTIGFKKMNKIFKGWTTTSGGSTVNYAPGAKYTVSCPTTSGATLLTLYPVWVDAPPEAVYIWQDPTKTTNNGYICWDGNDAIANGKQRVVILP